MVKCSKWNAVPDRFMALRHFSQERALHPTLVQQIEAHPGDQLLDYGCGDGRMLEMLSNRWSIDAYDPNPDMRHLAAHRVGHRLRHLTAEPSELQSSYDVINLGMVILCIPEADEVKRVFGDCASRMRSTSALFITTTHPCFRSWRFSNLETSFGVTQPFTYMQDGRPFNVTLCDPSTPSVSFEDYHWSLGFTVEALQSQGLSIESLLEVPDDPESPNRNELVPPFLILKCRSTL